MSKTKKVTKKAAKKARSSRAATAGGSGTAPTVSVTSVEVYSNIPADEVDAVVNMAKQDPMYYSHQVILQPDGLFTVIVVYQ
jgi:hypothetical protein